MTYSFIPNTLMFCRPMLQLPAIVASVANDKDTLTLLSQGINPADSPRLLSKFQATSTKQRADKILESEVSVTE